jgi:hypothetical protein
MGCLTLECYANNLAKGRGGGGTKGRGGLLRKGKRAGGPKEGRKAGVGCRYPRGKEKPRRVEPTGRGDWIELVTGDGGENEKEGEQQAKPKVT